MRAVAFFYNKSATLVASFLILALFFGLLFVQDRARSAVEEIRSALEAIKSDYLVALLGEHGSSTPQQAQERLNALIGNERLRMIVSSYALGDHGQTSLADLEHMNTLDRIRTLEGLTAKAGSEQRQSSETLVLLLGLIVLFIVALVLWSEVQNQKAILNSQHQRDLNEQLLESVERERSSLAFDLHDSVTQKLGFLKQQIEDHHGSCAHNYVISKLVAESLHEIRGIYQGLSHGDSPNVSLGLRLDDLFAQFALVSRIHLETSVFGLEGLDLDRLRTNHIFRIVQELLANGHKHSQAQSIKIHVYYVPMQLRIMYSDNGIGGPTSSGQLQPLRSLEYRVQILGATMRLGGPPEAEGLTLQIEVPLENRALG